MAKAGVQRRLTDSVETALTLAGGLLVVELVDAAADDPARERRFSEHRACPNDHELTLDEIEPRTFSFNAPYGACPECTGIGSRLEVDPDLVIPDEEATLADGAVAPWAQTSSEYFDRVLTALSRRTSASRWTCRGGHCRSARGSGPVRAEPRGPRAVPATGGAANGSTPRASRASSRFIERRHAETESDWSKERYEAFMREVPCPAARAPGSSPRCWPSGSAG